MEKNYFTIQKPAQSEIIVKKSRFIASVRPAINKAEAEDFIQQIKRKHSQATHNVFAYVINEQIQRCSDNGEPSGTAGKPVLEIINLKGLTKTVLVVTRYYGGILLGAGGLVRAYSQAAAKGIEAAGVVKKILHQELHIIMDYQWLGEIKREIENAGGKRINISYDRQVSISTYLQPEATEAVTKRIIDRTSAQVKINLGQFSYI